MKVFDLEKLVPETERNRGVMMTQRIELNSPAPEIDMLDYQGNRFQLSALKGAKRVLLVFNRGFQ
ncbi:MAG: hypothetical protein E4G99_05735 [Anaerolineales bacterium]|nr:MAG: hypothetical protein E4G99_05735 [Anaerolineales bacterium]